MSPGAVYTFDLFKLDGRARRLQRDGEHVALSDRYLSVLLHLAAHAGAVVSKDALVTAGWGDLAVTDNSLEQAISALRRVLGSNVPMNVAIVPSKAGTRVSFLTGFNMRRR